MTLPLISVCVANYNGLRVIDGCLQSILTQKGNFRLEILVHDDCSQDGSVAHLRQHYPTVKLIESCENVGFCIANNRMVEQALGEYLLLLNNDAELFPGALSALLSEALCLKAPAILGLPQYDASSGSLVDIGCRFDPFLNPVPNYDPKCRNVGMVIGACLWIPRNLWAKLGGFPEWFGSIAEDMYLCCRARLTGYPVFALEHSGYRHWQGGSFGGNRVAGDRLVTTFRRRALSERNKCFVMVVSFPVPWVYPVLLLHLLLLFLEGGILSLVKGDMRFWKEIYAPCFGGLWRERNRLRMLREVIQHSRRIGVAEFFSVFCFIPHKLRMLLRHGLPQLR